jgi:hypothetical protein
LSSVCDGGSLIGQPESLKKATTSESRRFGQASYTVDSMRPLVANTEDLISLLDRVLDKGIVMDKWACLSLQEHGLTGPQSRRIRSGSRIMVESSAVYVGYGNRGTWRHDLDMDEDLFPFWRRDLWNKKFAGK